ncbi:MAG: hypothetical protein VB878_11655 [Pirellulaceae bacterium]
MMNKIVNKGMDEGANSRGLARPLFGPDTVIAGVVSLLVCWNGLQSQTELQSLLIIAVI